MLRTITSTLCLAAALFAAQNSFACGDDHDKKGDKDESALSVGAPETPSCGDEDKKDDKDESVLSVSAPETPSCGDEDKKDDKDES